MIKIAPSLLSADFADLKNEIKFCIIIVRKNELKNPFEK